jgi:transposase
VISVCRDGRLVRPWVFEGACNTAVVDTYLAKVLLPFLPPGSVIVLDNARFHGASSTRALVAAAGCELLFLPAYSPDLNPIEHVWAAFKNALRPKLWKMKRKAAFIAKTALLFV